MIHHPTVAEVDLAALRHNFREVRKRLPPGCRVMAVVKANAYGLPRISAQPIWPSATSAARIGVARIAL